MLLARDLRYLRASQIKLTIIGEWVLGVAIVVFFVLGIRNFRLATVLAAEQGTTLMALLNRGFQVGSHYPGQFLFTLERINAGFFQVLIGALLAVTLYLAATVRRRNGRFLQLIKDHLSPAEIESIEKS